MSDDRLSFDDACKELGVSAEELEQLVAAGKIACLKEGDALLFKPEVVQNYKASADSEPMVLLSDDDLLDDSELDLLGDDDVGEIELDLLGDDDLLNDEEPASAASSDAPASGELPTERGAAESVSAESSLDDDDILSLDGEDLLGDDDLPDIDLGLDADVAAEADATDKLDLEEDTADVSMRSDDTGDDAETLLDMEGLLEEEAEATTPVAAGDDDLFNADLASDDLLDTADLDFGDETETFDIDAVDDFAGDMSEEGTLLRGGGARVMQMKRKQSHAGSTIGLALTLALMLASLAVVSNSAYTGSDAAAAGGKQAWVKEYNVLDGAVCWLADQLKER